MRTRTHEYEHEYTPTHARTDTHAAAGRTAPMTLAACLFEWHLQTNNTKSKYDTPIHTIIRITKNSIQESLTIINHTHTHALTNKQKSTRIPQDLPSHAGENDLTQNKQEEEGRSRGRKKGRTKHRTIAWKGVRLLVRLRGGRRVVRAVPHAGDPRKHGRCVLLHELARGGVCRRSRHAQPADTFPSQMTNTHTHVNIETRLILFSVVTYQRQNVERMGP
jgi:hypothetical protein